MPPRKSATKPPPEQKADKPARSSNRAMWSGNLEFGLIICPVQLFTATDDHSMKFRQVHEADGHRIRFDRRCLGCDEVVPYEDLAQGYEKPDGEIIVLTDADMENIPLPTKKTIAVQEFTLPANVDPLLWNKYYYVAPHGPAADRAFALVVASMVKSGKVGITKVTLRNRERLALLSVRGRGLLLTTMSWADEVRDPPIPFMGEADPRLVTQGVSLIDAMTGDFDPTAYKDFYTEALGELVEAKLNDTTITPQAQPEPAPPTTNLGDVLAASIAAEQEKRAKGKPKTTTRAARSKTPAA